MTVPQIDISEVGGGVKSCRLWERSGGRHGDKGIFWSISRIKMLSAGKEALKWPSQINAKP
jgi:hypothetical protein